MIHHFLMKEAQCDLRKHSQEPGLEFAMMQIGERILKNNKEMHICCIDLKKAFGELNREKIWNSRQCRWI